MPTTTNEYYLQESSCHVGNDLLFWAKGARGYTTDVSKAQIYTRAEALRQHQIRYTDVPWPKAYIDAKTRPAVDMQYISSADALAGTGIVLMKPVKVKPERYKCCGCGVFMSAGSYYSGPCAKCNSDNRP